MAENVTSKHLKDIAERAVQNAAARTRSLIALAEVVRSAPLATQAEAISTAWDRLGPLRQWTGEESARFARMIDAEAFESAAMMMLPPDTGFGIDRYWTSGGEAWSASICAGGLPDTPRALFELCGALAPGLAIAAVALAYWGD